MTYTQIFYLIEDSGKIVAWQILEAETNPFVRLRNRMHYFKVLYENKELIDFPLNKKWEEQKMKKLTKEEKEILKDCGGECNCCFYDGGCNLQDKLKEE